MIWKQPKYPSTYEWIKKFHKIKYHSVINKNEILPFATTLIDLEAIMLSETSLTKTNTVCYHLYVKSEK